MPAPVLFRNAVKEELTELQRLFGGLCDFELKLSTAALYARWNAEARDRHAGVKTRERQEWDEWRRRQNQLRVSMVAAAAEEVT